MNITVFGGASPKPGEPAYQDAYRLGQRLAQAGHCVLTGGYIGTMEAVSRGAAEANGHTIGVTCDAIESWRTVSPNQWVREERRFATLLERLNALIEGCDAAMALPGGPGTLTEIALMWNQMIIHALPQRPLILIGAGWRNVFDAFFLHLGEYVAERDRAWLLSARDVDQAVEMLK